MTDSEEASTSPQPKKKKAKGSSVVSWAKENPTAAKVGLAAVLLLVLAAVLVFAFSGDGNDSSRPSQQSGPVVVAPPISVPPPPTSVPSPQAEESSQQDVPESQPGDPSEPSSEDPGESEQPQPEPEQPLARPENLTEWKTVHYHSARSDDDPRLIEAVGHLGELFVGNAQAAQLLAELAAPPKAEEETAPNTRPAYRRPVRRQGTQLIDAIAAALAINATQDARTIIEQMLSGKLPTDDDLTTVAAIFQALAEHPCPENDAILLRAMCSAAKLRGQDQGDVTAEELQQEALAVVEAAASEQLRIELAKYLCRPDTPLEQRESLGQFLQEGLPENTAAQLVLYENDKTPEDVKALFEEYFAGYSAAALAKVLGIAEEPSAARRRYPARRPTTRPTTRRRVPPRRPGTGEPEKADPDLPYRLARNLWSAPCVTLVEQRLGGVESFDKQPQVLALAGTLPVDSTRSAVLKALIDAWDQGPKVLDAAGLSGKQINDPGFVPVLKALMRKQASVRAARKEDRDRLEKNREEWKKSVQATVRGWLDRFHAAAESGAKAAPVTGAEADAAATAPGAGPIVLHTGAKVVARYHAVFPGNASKQLLGVAPGPMKIDYVRIEENARWVTTQGYYKRQAKVRDAEDVGGAAWLDGYRIVPGSNRKCSIDVIITRTKKASDGDAEEAEDLVIEILAIEMKDPQQR